MARATRPHAWLQLTDRGGNLEVDDFLSMQLDRLSILMLRRVTQSYIGKHDLSLPEWRLLTLLARLPPISAARINSESGMDKGQISRALVLLEQRGFAQRVPDPGDGRSQLISITAAGRRRFDDVMPDARQSQAALLGLLSLSERKALLRILAKLTTAIEQPTVHARPRARPAQSSLSR